MFVFIYEIKVKLCLFSKEIQKKYKRRNNKNTKNNLAAIVKERSEILGEILLDSEGSFVQTLTEFWASQLLAVVIV